MVLMCGADSVSRRATETVRPIFWANRPLRREEPQQLRHCMLRRTTVPSETTVSALAIRP